MLGRRTLLALAALPNLLLPALILSSAAGAVRAAVIESTLDLVTGHDYAPFTGEDLPQGGMLTEVVLRAFKAMNLDYDVRFVPWKRGYDGVIAGKFLGTFPYVRTPEREQDALFSDPLLVVRQLVYISTRSPMEFHAPEDFKARAVCAPVGYALPPELHAMVQSGELTRESPADLPACVRMVASGRVDAFVIDEHTGQAAVARTGVGNEIRIAAQPFAQVAQHLIVSKANPEAPAVLAAFNAGLKKLKDSGAFDNIVRRHTALNR